MSDNLEITYCPHCKRPVSITEVTSLPELPTSDATGDVKEQSPDMDPTDEEITFPPKAKRRKKVGFKP